MVEDGRVVVVVSYMSSSTVGLSSSTSSSSGTVGLRTNMSSSTQGTTIAPSRAPHLNCFPLPPKGAGPGKVSTLRDYPAPKGKALGPGPLAGGPGANINGS